MSEADVVIGLDLGTSGVKAVALDARGRVMATAQRAVTLITDDAGKAEQSVEEVWRATQAVLGEMPDLLKQVTLGSVRAICVSGAMHSVVVIDEAGRVTGNATTWADQRCAPIAERMRDEVDIDAMYRRTGCPFSALYHPARLRWMAPPPEVRGEEEKGRTGIATGVLKHPGLRKFVAIKDVIVHRLTGTWCTDASVASATGLMDIRSWQWDDEALRLAGITADQLPEIAGPTQLVGETADGIPVIAGASDGALANVGAAGFHFRGRTVITLGTSGAVRRIVPAPVFDSHRRTWCYVVERDRYLHGGAINSGGIAVQHAIQQAYGTGAKAPPEVRQAHLDAATIAPGSDGLMVLPFVTGERGLIWPPEARWTVIGRQPHHTPAHLVRATMEGVAYCIATMWEVVMGEDREASSDQSRAASQQLPLLTGGVVRSAAWRQIVADVLGVALQPVEAADASAVGAAIMGWRALGEDVQPLDGGGPVIKPNMANHTRYIELFRGFAASCREGRWM